MENSRLTGRRGRCILEISSETGYIGQFFGMLQVLRVFIYSTLHGTVWPNRYVLLVQYAVLKTAYHHFLTRCNMSDFWRLECDALSTRTTSNAAAEGVVELIADGRWAKMEGCQQNKLEADQVQETSLKQSQSERFFQQATGYHTVPVRMSSLNNTEAISCLLACCRSP